MRDRLYRKGLVFAIILLFIGMSVFPSTGTQLIGKTSTTNLDGSATYSSQETLLSDNNDVDIYIYAGLVPKLPNPKAPSIGPCCNAMIINHRNEPIEWYTSHDRYFLSGEQFWHSPPNTGWEYQGSVEPNEQAFDLPFFIIGPYKELIKVNVMVDDIIFSRWCYYLGHSLHYFPRIPRIGGGDSSIEYDFQNLRSLVAFKSEAQEKGLMNKSYTQVYFEKHLFPEYLSKELNSQMNTLVPRPVVSTPSKLTNRNSVVEESKEESRQTTSSSNPIDSPWPMYCHDNQHTGRSPYITSHNQGYEKWRHKIVGIFTMSPSIGNDGTIYVPGSCLYAIYPNGTRKWKFDPLGGVFNFMCPAIDENGTIYVGTISDKYKYMYAINPDGTVKWKKSVGSIYSPPTIGNNGMIYFAQLSDKSYITALLPDGTTKWKSYTSEEPIISSPAIGKDGTIYCGSHDCNLYAFNSDGTFKWKFNTGGRVHGSPSIGSDGTIFIGSENGLHAVYPNNGSMKWHSHIEAVWGALAIDLDDTLYVGDWAGKFYAINPDGTIKWTYNAPGPVWFTSPALSADGIIYFGTIGASGGKGKVVALNSDGTERWTWKDSYYYYENFQSAPAIGEDGTVYMGSSHWMSGGPFYLHAFGVLDSNAPNAPTISGPTNGKPWKKYEYTFKSIDPNGDNVYYYIDWGDGSEEAWIGPYSSGEEVKVDHIWAGPIPYTICAKAKDTDDFFGPWGTLEVTLPRNKATFGSFWLRFLELFPILQKILCYIL